MEIVPGVTQPDPLLRSCEENLKALPSFEPDTSLSQQAQQQAELKYYKQRVEKVEELYRQPQTAMQAGHLSTEW